MKRIILFIIFLQIIFLVGCKKNNESSINDYVIETEESTEKETEESTEHNNEVIDLLDNKLTYLVQLDSYSIKCSYDVIIDNYEFKYLLDSDYFYNNDNEIWIHNKSVFDNNLLQEDSISIDEYYDYNNRISYSNYNDELYYYNDIDSEFYSQSIYKVIEDIDSRITETGEVEELDNGNFIIKSNNMKLYNNYFDVNIELYSDYAPVRYILECNSNDNLDNYKSKIVIEYDNFNEVVYDDIDKDIYEEYYLLYYLSSNTLAYYGAYGFINEFNLLLNNLNDISNEPVLYYLLSVNNQEIDFYDNPLYSFDTLDFDKVSRKISIKSNNLLLNDNFEETTDLIEETTDLIEETTDLIEETTDYIANGNLIINNNTHYYVSNEYRLSLIFNEDGSLFYSFNLISNNSYVSMYPIIRFDNFIINGMQIEEFKDKFFYMTNYVGDNKVMYDIVVGGKSLSFTFYFSDNGMYQLDVIVI